MPYRRGNGWRASKDMPAGDEAATATLTRLRREIVDACACEVAELVGGLLSYVDEGDACNGQRMLVELRRAYACYVDASLTHYDKILRSDLTDT